MVSFIVIRDPWEGKAEVVGTYGSFRSAESAVKTMQAETSPECDYSITEQGTNEAGEIVMKMSIFARANA